jgi:hypothetical protein
MKAVTVGPTIGSLQVVEEGLSAGDVIVVEGLQKVKDGAVVRTKPYAMDAAEAGSLALPDGGTATGPRLEAESSPTPEATPAPAPAN